MQIVAILNHIENNDKKTAFMFSTDIIFMQTVLICGWLNPWMQNLYIQRADYTQEILL